MIGGSRETYILDSRSMYVRTTNERLLFDCANAFSTVFPNGYLNSNFCVHYYYYSTRLLPPCHLYVAVEVPHTYVEESWMAGSGFTALYQIRAS